MGLYVDLLEATKGTNYLQGIQRRARGAKEPREEIAWVQARVLRYAQGMANGITRYAAK